MRTGKQFESDRTARPLAAETVHRIKEGKEKGMCLALIASCPVRLQGSRQARLCRSGFVAHSHARQR